MRFDLTRSRRSLRSVELLGAPGVRRSRPPCALPPSIWVSGEAACGGKSGRPITKENAIA